MGYDARRPRLDLPRSAEAHAVDEAIAAAARSDGHHRIEDDAALSIAIYARVWGLLREEFPRAVPSTILTGLHLAMARVLSAVTSVTPEELDSRVDHMAVALKATIREFRQEAAKGHGDPT